MSEEIVPIPPTDITPIGTDKKTGKFVKGFYKGGPGNPEMKHYNKLRDTFIKSVKTSDIKELVQSAVRKAKGRNGSPDYMWTKLVFDFLIPKPKQDIDANITITEQLSPQEIQAKLDVFFGIIVKTENNDNTNQ